MPALEERQDNIDALSINIAAPAIKAPFRIGRSKFPVVRQQAMLDCAAACLATVCAYYGTRTSLNALSELLQTGRNGTSMTNIIRGARDLGFDTCSYKSTWDQLTKAPLPAITNWNDCHWIVIYKIINNRVIAGDPAKGLVEYSKEEFEKSWTRLTVFLSPTEKFKKLVPAERKLKHFFKPILTQKKIIEKVFLSSISIKIFAIFLPLLNMHIIDNVLIKGDSSLFLPSVAVVFLVTLSQLLMIYFRQNLLLFAGKKISISIMAEFYKHLLSLPLNYFETRATGDITTRFGQNGKITDFFIYNGIQMFLDLAAAIMISIIFFTISPVLLIISLAFILVDVLLLYFTSPLMQKNFQNTYTKMTEMQSHFIESLMGMQTVRTLGISHQVRWKYENNYIAYMNARLKTMVLSIGVDSITGFISSLTQASLLFTGAYMIFNGQISIGALVAFLSLVSHVRDPLVNIIRNWGKFQETLNAMERVNDIFDAAPEFSDNQSKDQLETLVELPSLNGNIHFNNLSFRYMQDSEDNILQNINLQIHAGQKIAFVGRSGSGKSTLVKLIYGFYKPGSGKLSGKLTIDGFDIGSCHLPSLRKQLGMVMQDDFLFSGTIRENLILTKPETKFSEIVEASKAAAAHEFIMSLPGGYEAVLKDSGSNLSEGQRQRLCLARVMIQNPKILILDEATSALDNESERYIIDNLMQQFSSRTIISISHRLSTIKNYDYIYVMDKGCIVEQGTHEKLMAERAMYYLLNS